MSTYTIKTIDTDNASVPTGNGFTAREIIKIVRKYDLERKGNLLVAEWGNGEGSDQYQIIPEGR